MLQALYANKKEVITVSTNNSVIEALKVAVDQSPDDVALRMHLAKVLDEAGQAQEALDHLSHVLTLDPVHIDALTLAALCAEQVEDQKRAEGYWRILDSLGATDANKNPSDNSTSQNKGTTRDSVNSKTPKSTQAGKSVEGTGLRVIDGGPDSPVYEEKNTITLDDVGGMEAVKRRLHLPFLAPLKNPELKDMYGKRLQGGLLLYGPPGCGKTFIARALAGELGAKFVSIGLTDVLDMWLGNSERNLHEVFSMARRSSPSVMFIDELDALGQKRNQTKHGAGRNIVNQLLVELDGVDANNEGLFLLAATNHPWDVDTALRRPGRFDRVVLVLPPDLEARVSILQYHMKDRPAASIDYNWLANRTNNFSGADLLHLCDSATELAMEVACDTGKTKPIEMDDFKRALSDLRPSTLPCCAPDSKCVH
jgi:SpoVK/Ycf46/Vps4 family AAA+-type ATPase